MTKHQNWVSPTEILAGKLAALKKTGITKIKRRDLHNIVASEKWEGFSVDGRGALPYSNTLEEALSNLLMCNVVWSHWVYGEGDWVMLSKWGNEIERDIEL